MPKPKNGLTPKQQRFVQEYTISWNATQAAIKAGYSKRAAAAIGHETLRNPKVAKAIEGRQAKRAAKTEITAQYVLDQASVLHTRCMAKGRNFAPNAAARALELIGKHINVNAFVRDEQHLHVHLNGLQERLGSARMRMIEKPIDVGLLESGDDEERAN